MPTKTSKLIDLLERVEEAGAGGVLECCPNALKEGGPPALAYSASGKLTKSQKTGFAGLDLWSHLEALDARTLEVPAKAAGKPPKRISVQAYGLGPQGVRCLSEYRGKERKAQVDALRTELTGIADLPAWASALTDTLAARLDALQADITRDLEGLLHRRLKPLQDQLEHARAASESLAVVVSERVPDLQRRLSDLPAPSGVPPQPTTQVACLSADSVLAEVGGEWTEIPAVHDALVARGFPDLPGALRDVLSELARDSRIQLAPWNRNLVELPRPEHAMMFKDARVMYYVRRIPS